MGGNKMKGVVFDIKEFAVFDGPGIRTTVFLKGCPLRCTWCHNPEGLSAKKQLMVKWSQCLHCGKCMEVCQNPKHCILCGDCILSCPLHLRRICGTEWESADLAERIRRDEGYLAANGGGVTFSGGEPTYQPEFLLETLQRLEGIHRAIETSGYCRPEWFQTITGHLELVIMDIKQTDRKLHKKYTGQDNEMILQNLEYLKQGSLPFMIRIPLIPGITDTEENLEQTASLLERSRNLLGVELLPYHQTAGAKYGMIGRAYQPGFQEDQMPREDTSPFLERGIPCRVL